MTGPVDPRLSDENTGLPPLGELGDDEVLVALAWLPGEGLVHNPLVGDTVAVRYLHVRGLANSDLLAGTIEWAQTHIAVPVDVALDVAADLARGTTFEDDAQRRTPHRDLVDQAVNAVNAMRALLEKLGAAGDADLGRLEVTILRRLEELQQ